MRTKNDIKEVHCHLCAFKEICYTKPIDDKLPSILAEDCPIATVIAIHKTHYIQGLRRKKYAEMNKNEFQTLFESFLK